MVNCLRPQQGLIRCLQLSTYIVRCYLQSQWQILMRLASPVPCFNCLLPTCGVPDTIISDRGSGRTAKVTEHLCTIFTPSFHTQFHAPLLRGCDRTHRTLGERLAVLCKGSLQKWHDYLSSVVFSKHCAFKSTLGYSNCEIICGMRPCFPLKPYMCVKQIKFLLTCIIVCVSIAKG